MPSRRTFLTASAAGAAGSLLAACRATANEIDDLPRGRPRRSDYTLDPAIAYLNHGAIGTTPAVVQRARQRYLDLCETNPAHYMWNEAWQEPREQVRRELAALIGCGSDELAITHNTTEGFNVLAQGLPLAAGDEVLFSSWNHAGASICFDHGARRRGYVARRLELDIELGKTLTPEDCIERHVAACTDRTRLVVLPHIDNLVGYRTPVRELTRALRDRGVEFVAADGAQAVGMIPVDIGELGVDFYAGSPHKWLQTPKGLGLLYVRQSLQSTLEPMWRTWGQQRWAGSARVFEDYGTRNLPEVLALGDAVRFHRRTDDRTRANALRGLRELAQELAAAHPRTEFGSPASFERGSSLFAVRVRDTTTQELGERLAAAGVVVRLFPANADVRVRVSPNLLNDEQDLRRFFAALPA